MRAKDWIIICGFFSAGKSTVGAGLAEKLELPFIDLDQKMAVEYGKSQREIWKELGEKKFRDFETSTLKKIDTTLCVLAVGGGALLREENRLRLKEKGLSIYLRASWETLKKRVNTRGMPAYAANLEELERIARYRFPIYEGHCERWIDTDAFTENEVIGKLAHYA